ncbi:MAG: tetratricopeptide repeat protein [Methanomassiliicoccales archaeon]|nr:MAG: tetratricopeptide repeat protein [Methanomassiliicoccales archaeon]
MVIEKGFQSKFVGREEALDELKNRLDESLAGRGQLALISGEAGIGKTRLLHELKKYASSNQVRCLEGGCIYHDVSNPYLPFLTAFSELTTPSFVDEAKKYVMIDEAFLINNAGKVVSYASRIGANILDEDIVGAMLSAVESFVKDAFGDGESAVKGLDTLVYGTIRIFIEHGKHVFLAVVLSGGEPEGIREDLKKLVNKIEDKYHDVLKDWDGQIAKVREISEIISGLTTVKYRVKLAIRDIDIKEEKDRVFERVLQLIIETAEDEPLLLILEDIHWADTSSLQLLQYVTRNTQESRVFICGTYRPEELDDVGDKKVHPLKEAIQRMSRHKMFAPIELTRLPPSEVSDMLTSIFGMPEFPSGFKERIFKETEGNPFFIEEMLHSFQDEGAISFKEGGWHISEVSGIAIPSTIKDLIALRIERLDEGSMNAIKYASVIGQEFGYEVLKYCLEIDEETFVNLLDKLMEAKLIYEAPEDSAGEYNYRFAHGKITEVIYEGLSSGKRRLIHSKVGEAIEELNQHRIEDVVYDLAYHFFKSRRFDKARYYAKEGGDKAIGSYAAEDAIGYYELALESLKRSQDREPLSESDLTEEIETLSKLGDVCYIIGEWDRALEYQRQLIELSGKIGDKARMLGGYCAIGYIYFSRGEWKLALENLEKGLRIGEETEDDRGIADSLYFLGALHEKRGDFNEAIINYGESMGRAVNMGDNLLIGNAYLGIGRVYGQQGQYDESIKHMQKSIEIFKENENLNDLAKAYINLGQANFCRGSLEESILYYDKGLKIAKKTGNIRLEGHGLSNLGESYTKKYELEKAIYCLDKALEIFKKLDEKSMISDVYTHFGCVYRLKQEWDRSKDYFKKSLEISRELNMPYYVGCGLLEFGLMHKAKGDLEKAKEQLSEAMEIFKYLNNQEMLKKIEKELEALF